MRMWMVNPKIMCRNHLLGEHNEIHMFVGTLKRGNKLDGYVHNNCLEFKSLENRHNSLAEEMISRGYNHKSPIDMPKDIDQSDLVINSEVDKEKSLNDLLSRCKNCEGGKMNE